MERVFQHEIVYQMDDQATVEEIAAALIANARFAREAVGVIGACHRGIQVSHLDVRLSSLSQQSPLKEMLTVALVLGFQEDLEDEVPDFINAMTGIDVPDRFDSMVTVFVVGIGLYAALQLVERFIRARPQERRSKSALEASYQSVTHVAGDLVQVPPEKVQEVIESRLGGGKSRSMAKAARDFFAPAKRYNASSISTSSEINISRDVINEVPGDIDEIAFTPRQDEYDVSHAKVNLRAHNLDSDKSGWAAIIEDVYPERVRLHLDPSIPAERLFTRSYVLADVKVHAQENEDGDMVPFLYIVTNIHDH